MIERKSYPTAEDPERCIQVLSKIQGYPYPKLMTSKLTKKLSMKYPILYNITLQNHFVSAYFELLEMLGLCKLSEKTEKWFVYDFISFLKKNSAFNEEQIKEEILDFATTYKITKKIKVYSITKSGKLLLELEKDSKLKFMMSYFYKFLNLSPSYFRIIIQNPEITNICEQKKKALHDVLFNMIKKTFPTFTKDDISRITGWSEYFKILKREKRGKTQNFYFNINAIVQYFGYSLANYLTIKSKKISHHNWQELESELYRDIFCKNSILRIENILEIILEQNSGKYRWGIIERGPVRYKGFRGNPARQMLHIKEVPLTYQFEQNHTSRVVTT